MASIYQSDHITVQLKGDPYNQEQDYCQTPWLRLDQSKLVRFGDEMVKVKHFCLRRHC